MIGSMAPGPMLGELLEGLLCVRMQRVAARLDLGDQALGFHDAEKTHASIMFAAAERLCHRPFLDLDRD